MKSLLIKSYAKINIVLNIKGKQEDGYHQLDMVMLPLALHDSILLSKVPNAPDNYVTTDGRLRKLTPRECLRLMGFSDDFKIVVPNVPAYRQAGNSIVVNVLEAIFKNIFEAVNIYED